ncbi:MAG TPA: Gfo/Idh/MocA family oxidoreductase [Bryobacteraceae bacterium]|nr:Gfo/Idh/MocA family oxidoreductase [Bryobacteraceae bacterium]
MSKRRFGVVGLGGVADRIHIPACLAVEDIDLVAGCDPSESSRQRVAGKFKLPEVYSSFDEMLEKSKLHGVIIGTPPDSHFEIASRAIEAGLHVFCEKPFMSTLEQADEIIELARSNRRALRVNNQYRYMSFYRETKRRLDAGEFGRAFYLQFWQQMFHPPSSESNWRKNLTKYVLYEFGTHALDLACFLFGSLPSSIRVLAPKARAEFDADVLLHATLEFPEERIAVFSFNRISHAPEKYLECRLDCNDASVRVSLGGVARLGVEWSKHAGRPVLKAGFVKGGEARVERGGKTKTFCSSARGEFATATAEHLRVFVGEMGAAQPPLESAIHAREVLRLVFEGYRSAESGEVVRLPR